MLQSFEQTSRQENRTALKKQERSEMLIFEARIYEKLGDLQGAINSLVTKQGDIADKVALHENLAKLYLKVGDKDKAIDELE